MLQPTTNPASPEYWAEQFQASVEYRRDNFDTEWKSVVEYAEANSDQIRRGTKWEGLSHIVDIPHVKLNSERKVAALSGQRFYPVLESDAADLPNYQTVQQLVLRWAWRQARADSKLTGMLRDFCDFGISVAQTTWNRYALDGRGAPNIEHRDIVNFYLDPSRRDTDVNVDCRWIIEVQRLSMSQARSAFPHYFTEEYAASDGTVEVGSDEIYGQQSKSEKDGFVNVARIEFVVYEGNSKKVYQSIIDIAKKAWIVEPNDNKLGRYSYVFMSLPLRRGHAYPESPTLAEQGLSDLINGAYSIYVDEAFRTAVPITQVHSQDESLKRSVRDPNATDPGAVWEYDIEPATSFVSPRAFKALDLANTVKEELQNVGMMPDVLRGTPASGVRSGRQYAEMKASAAVPMKAYDTAYYEAAVCVANNLFAIVKKYVKEARFLTIDINGAKQILPVNIAEQSQEISRFNEMNIPQEMIVPTARVNTPDGQVVMPRGMAENYAVENEIPLENIELSVNDISYGNAEANVEVKTVLSQMDRTALAQMLLSNGHMGPIRALKEMNFENPEQIVAEADERNQILQYGQMVLQDPLLNALATQPELRTRAAAVLNIVLSKPEDKSTKKQG